MHSYTSRPLIPDDLVEKLKADPKLDATKSMVTTKEWRRIRLSLVKTDTGGNSPDGPVVLPEDELGTSYTLEDRKTWLHYASEIGDPCVALEIIRLGATIDSRDNKGHTPLSRGMMMASWSSLIVADANASTPWALCPDPVAAEKNIDRMRWVCRLLVEQHADVNVVVDDIAPLDYACLAKDWEAIELLLVHGAEPRRQDEDESPVGQLCSEGDDKERFHKLVAAAGKRVRRPPRICPCWSGKVISECHGAGPKPYPVLYVCRCGSGKSYGRCCSKRGIEYWEQWDEEDQWICYVQKKALQFPKLSDGMPPVDVSQLAESMRSFLSINNDPGFRSALSQVDPEFIRQEQVACIKELLRPVEDLMVPLGLVDPAFAYALAKAQFLPIPRGRSYFSKDDGAERATEWNNLVDEYISQGTDLRPRIEIESRED